MKPILCVRLLEFGNFGNKTEVRVDFKIFKYHLIFLALQYFEKVP